MKFALITARGGSKGLPRKNILPLGDKPLIAWTINAALDAKSIDRVFVSTEDDEIAKISVDFGAEIISRPAEFAKDESSSEDVITHAITYWQAIGLSPDSIALLQPTSPFRSAIHVDEAYDVFEHSNANMVLGVFEPRFCLAKAYKINNDGTISGMLSSEAPYSRRQDLPAAYIPNGAIYLINSQSYQEGFCIPKTNVFPYIMNEESSMDIDTKDDLMAAERLIVRNEK